MEGNIPELFFLSHVFNGMIGSDFEVYIYIYIQRKFRNFSVKRGQQQQYNIVKLSFIIVYKQSFSCNNKTQR